GVVRPGQYAGRLGTRWDAWHLNVAAKCPLGNGACPECFRFDGSNFRHAAGSVLDPPRLSLPEGHFDRLRSRIGLLEGTESRRPVLLERAVEGDLDRHRR